jgi:hypothetical protein
LNPGRGGGKPATNRLSYGAATYHRLGVLMTSALHMKRKFFSQVKPRCIFRGRHEAKEGHVLLVVVIVMAVVIIIIIIIIIINVSSSQVIFSLLKYHL